MFLAGWLEKKMIRDYRLQAEKQREVCRELERRERTVLRKKEKGRRRGGEYYRRQGCCDTLVEYTWDGTESLQVTKPRVVSFTLPSTGVVEGQVREGRAGQGRASVMVTSGGLILLLLCAAMVTASFLMSPAIESMFSKYFTFIFNKCSTYHDK